MLLHNLLYDGGKCAMSALIFLIAMASIFALYQLIRNYNFFQNNNRYSVGLFKAMILTYFFLIYGLALIDFYWLDIPGFNPAHLAPYIRPATFLLILSVGIDEWITYHLRRKSK